MAFFTLLRNNLQLKIGFEDWPQKRIASSLFASTRVCSVSSLFLSYRHLIPELKTNRIKFLLIMVSYMSNKHTCPNLYIKAKTKPSPVGERF